MVNAVVNSIPVTWASSFALSFLLCLFCALYLLFIVKPFESELGLYVVHLQVAFIFLRARVFSCYDCDIAVMLGTAVLSVQIMSFAAPLQKG